MLHRAITLPAGRHTASLIFLHGSGDTGVAVQSWVHEVFDRIGDRQAFKFNHIKVIYPTAPLQPYTPLNGRPSNVWYDRVKISMDAPGVTKSVDSMTKQLSEIIQEERNAGIPLDRIIVGGFSMGGAMALHLGYGRWRNIRGAFALSSFLNTNSSVYDAIRELRGSDCDVILPELFMCHGKKDSLVLHEWGQKTYDRLTSLGVRGQFHSLDLYHEIGTEEMCMLRKWVLDMVPEKLTQNKL